MPARPRMDDEHDCYICSVMCDCGEEVLDSCLGCSTCAAVNDDDEYNNEEEYDDDAYES